MKKLGVLGLFPVPQITQVLDECWVVEILVLRQICAYRGIPEEEEEDDDEEEEDAKKRKGKQAQVVPISFVFFF